MMYQEFCRIVSDVDYKDWGFVTTPEGDHFVLQVAFAAPCSETGEVKLQSGRKWRVSRHSTRSEVVQTCLKAVLTAVEHEAREDFLYRGAAVFGPHVDVDALHELAVAGATDTREPVSP